MALNYRIIPRKIMAGEDAGKTKYYGQVVRSKLVPYKQLCQQLMVQSSATRGDVSLILDNLVDTILVHLENGHSVQLGDLGTFRMSAGSYGVESEDEFKASLMKRPRVIFSPGAELRARAAQAKFEKDTVKTIIIDEDCPLLHVE
ncbi:MAG: HU family DNA-binding protein [Tannerellaceae bacterium]|nr:HU family DNA-binding protein [Tannerellaceae bacterium]